MQKMKAEEALKYVIETVKSHLRELYDSEVVDTDFIYGEKTAYVDLSPSVPIIIEQRQEKVKKIRRLKMQGLKVKRQERGMTLFQLANAIGVKQAAISLWEIGKRFPRKDTLDKLCKFFDCKVDDLL